MDIMPGVKYFLRQANAFLSLAQETTDAELRERYRMMAERYRTLAAGSAEQSAERTTERMARKEFS
jgi:3-methyladenine DNA glycosylase/8-oxoguanine DNA glycosylase